MKNSLLLFLTLQVFSTINAQGFEVPKDVVLNTAEDYHPYESDVINAVKWLNENPVDQDTEKRKKVNEFLLLWMTGAPNVSIEVVEGLVPGGYPDLLMAFLGGWTKFSLEHEYSNDKPACALAGIENTLEMYEKNKNVFGKIKDLDKLLKKKKKGKLAKFVESKF